MPNKFMDPLAASDDSASSSGSDSDRSQDAKRVKPTATKESEADLEALVSGKSVLFVPEPKPAGQQNWDWGSGTAHKDAGGDDETQEDRQATREATGNGLESSVDMAFKATQRAAALKEAQRQEAQALAQERRLTYQQREKRKREAGQAKGGGKNFVEEEKRLARAHGVYSGFD